MTIVHPKSVPWHSNQEWPSICADTVFQLSHLSVRPSLRCLCVRKLTPFSAVISQNVTNKSFMVCVDDEKYAILVTLGPIGSIRNSKAEIHTL